MSWKERMIKMSGNNSVGGNCDSGSGSGSGFTLIVVLFILLIVVGAAFVDGSGYGGNNYGNGCY